MGRFADWLLGTVEPAPATIRAGAAGVALARTGRMSRANTPFGFGPPLAGFDVPDDLFWWDRDAAMSLPAVSRSRDLHCAAVGALPFTLWTVDLSGDADAVDVRRPLSPWMVRPDPDRTRQWILAWTTDDLFFHGRAHWQVTARYADGNWPMAFRRIAPGNLDPDTDPAWVHVLDEYTGTRRRIPAADVIEFLSPIEGLLSNGARSISIALQLDSAAERFAGTEVPSGVLEEQEGGEDLSADELADLADTFTVARQTNTTAALNKHVRYKESTYDASKMQLVEGRTYQALEMSRLGNVPPYLVGAPAGTGMTYQNGQQARQDLIDFGTGPYIGCIEQTLSGPNVIPHGQAVRLDLNAWLRNPFTTTAGGEQSPNDLQIAEQTEVPR